MIRRSREDEHPYFVELEADEETQRLLDYHRWLTEFLGGLLPEPPALAHVGRILDVGCGPGNWVLDAARTSQQMEVVGIDLSESRVAFAKQRARQQLLTRRVSFQVMDARCPLAFPDGSFDLVHARLLQGFMPARTWPAFLAECRRINRSGGNVRLTECEVTITTSPALERLAALHTQALWRAGYSFSPDGRQVGITAVLPSLLQQAGYQQVRHLAQALDCSAGRAAHAGFVQNFTHLLPLLEPWLIEAGLITPGEVERLCEQALTEISAASFCGIWWYLTVSGQKA